MPSRISRSISEAAVSPPNFTVTFCISIKISFSFSVIIYHLHEKMYKRGFKKSPYVFMFSLFSQLYPIFVFHKFLALNLHDIHGLKTGSANLVVRVEFTVCYQRRDETLPAVHPFQCLYQFCSCGIFSRSLQCLCENLSGYESCCGVSIGDFFGISLLKDTDVFLINL